MSEINGKEPVFGPKPEAKPEPAPEPKPEPAAKKKSAKKAAKKRSRPVAQTKNVETPVQEPLKQTSEFSPTETGAGEVNQPSKEDRERITDITEILNKNAETGELSSEERKALKKERRKLILGK